MATTNVTSHLDLNHNQLLNFLFNPLSADPTTPVNGQAWLNTSEGRLKIHSGNTTQSIALLSDASSGGVVNTVWDAQSVVVAIADDVPQAATIAEGGFLGRLVGGNITGLSNAQARTSLGIPAGTVATETFVTTAIADLFNTAPAELDTMIEIINQVSSNETLVGNLTTQVSVKTDSYAANIGDGAATTITVTHSLGTEDVVVSVRELNGPAVIAEWEPVSTSAIELRFNSAPLTNQYRVVVIG